MEDIKKSVSRRVLAAKESAPRHREWRKLDKKREKIIGQFSRGRIDNKKAEELIGNLPELGGEVIFDTLPELIVALKMLNITEVKRAEILDHENAHALAAVQKGFDVSYSIQFSKDSYFGITVTRYEGIAVNIDTAEPTPDDLRDIARAPQTLTDGSLSSSDKNILD